MTCTVDDYITYTISFLWLILLIFSIIQLLLEYLRVRKLENAPQNGQPLPQPQFQTPPVPPTTIPTSHSISSLSHVYMENGILNVRLGNPRIVAVSSSSRDWSNPSAFLDRSQQEAETIYTMRRFPSAHGLTKNQIEKIAPIKNHVKQPNDEKIVCVICLDDILQGQRRRDLPCGHSFHAKCILIWLQRANRCPCCAKAFAPRDARDDLPIPSLEHAEPRRFFGFRELSRTNLADRREQRPRHHGLWSFSNRRVNRVHASRRTSWSERRGVNQFRTHINRSESHPENMGPSTSGSATPRSRSRDELENLNVREASGFQEILDIDSNDRRQPTFIPSFV